MNAHLSPARLAALALAAALILPWPLAAQPARPTPSRGTAVASPASSNLLAQAWGALVGLWEEIGCGIDPSGLCASAPPAEIGCLIDPNGLCATQTGTSGQQDIGCLIDPSGAH